MAFYINYHIFFPPLRHTCCNLSESPTRASAEYDVTLSISRCWFLLMLPVASSAGSSDIFCRSGFWLVRFGLNREQMASLLPSLAAYSCYKDRYYEGTQPEYMNEMAKSCTLYVGNLSFYTTEEQIYELFSKSGEIKRIIMGLDRFKKTPCGFCFVEYYRRQDAMDCMKYISGTKLDDRPIRTDLDPGYKEGRQFGRGASGGQVRYRAVLVLL